MEPHLLSVEQLAKKYATNLKTGLSEQQVINNRELYGPNILPQKRAQSWLTIFFKQFESPLIYILLVAAAIVFFVSPDPTDAVIISVVLIFNAIVGTIQEGRALSILESLKKLIITECFVIRDGKKKMVKDADLVVGDIILVQEGHRVPADARIIESNNLQIDQAVLTGESTPATKHTQIVEDEAGLAERTNMLYQGTYTLAGSGQAIVIATGTNTEIGKIHAITEEIHTDMPLKKEIDRLSYFILIGIFILCVVLFVVGWHMGKPMKELLVTITALFIAVVPEGLPIVFTVALVAGVYRMAQEKVLVKRMQAVEALGRTQVIIIDKTGTLTRNEMIVTSVFCTNMIYEVSGSGYHVTGEVKQDDAIITDFDQHTQLSLIGSAAALLNSAQIAYDPQRDLFTIKGDPTEAALYIFSQKIGLSFEKCKETYEKMYEIPFQSHAQYHAGFYKVGGQGVAFIIGSPEVIIARSKLIDDQTTVALTQLLDGKSRVVAIATAQFSIDNIPTEQHQQLTFFKDIIKNELDLLGLIGIQDSIRPEVHSIIEQARQAGLAVIMATGDHQKTALYVAKEVGIFHEGDRVIDGAEFSLLSQEELIRNLNHTTVYSRVTPADKLKIVKLFHKLGKIVAMTGDGVNDAPSLVAADLGIAMGQIGTEVAKAAADLILLDDSFVNIIKAIEQGRHIFYALRRVVSYFFATNLGEIVLVLCALSLGLPLPITAAQILWLNLVTDGFLDSALAMEPKEQGLLHKRWLKKRLRLVDKYLIAKILYMAVPMGIGSMWVFYHYYNIDLTYARTMTLLTMAMFQWFNAWNCRSERLSIFQLGLLTNRWLILATLFVLALQILVIYAPFMQTLFKTVPVSGYDWVIAIVVSVQIVVLEELRKSWCRSKKTIV